MRILIIFTLISGVLTLICAYGFIVLGGLGGGWLWSNNWSGWGSRLFFVLCFHVIWLIEYFFKHLLSFSCPLMVHRLSARGLVAPILFINLLLLLLLLRYRSWYWLVLLFRSGRWFPGFLYAFASVLSQVRHVLTGTFWILLCLFCVLRWLLGLCRAEWNFFW